MIRVLRIINRFNLGGPTYNVAYLTKYLPENYQTILMGGVPEKHEADSLHILNELNIQPHIIQEMSRSIHIFNDYKAYLKIRKIIQEFQPHIVHTHASKAGLLGRLAAIHENVPVIVHTFHGHVFHSYFNPITTHIFIQIEKYLAKKSSKIIAISQLQKKELSEKYKIDKPDKFEVIPLGLDLKKFSENTEQKKQAFRTEYQLSDKIIAGIVGRLAPVKNHYLLIDAIKIIKEQKALPIEVLIIGDGELKNNLMQYILEKGMTYRTLPQEPVADFYFTSWIQQMDKAYAALDMVILCSKNEGTPVSLIEAQAAGKYIISSNVGGVKDILNPQAGIILNAYTAKCLADSIILGAQNIHSKNHFIQQHISENIITQYSFQTLVNNMDMLYQKLLKMKNISV